MSTAGGRFIVFEGGDGSGKTTQSKMLAQHLEGGGRPVLHLHEPGGTRLGEEVRRLLLHREAPLADEAELLLFLAARAQLVRAVILPALADGAIVISDRFSASTQAYQGFGRGLDRQKVRELDIWATGGLVPDLTFLFDLPVAEARRRLALRHQATGEDAIQREDDAFHERVRQGYLALAREDPARWLVLDATRPADDLARAVAARVDALARPS